MALLEQFDYQDFNSRMESNAELMVLVAKEYVRESDEVIEMLDAAALHMNFEDVRSLAHRLKGASAELSARQLSESAKQLENVANTRDKAQVLALVDLIKEMNSALILEIRQTLAL